MTNRLYRTAALPLLAGLLAFALSATPHAAAQSVIYVNAAATGANNGSSWADAYQTVQPAVDAAQVGDQVWVAAGRYVGSILHKEDVALYGGFAGTEAPATFDLATRDFATHETILDGNHSGSVLVVPQQVSSACRIDGFTITNARSIVDGGGIHAEFASPTIANNVITGNRTSARGGGLSLVHSNAIVTNNRIVANQADSSGGGVFLFLSAPELTNNCITGNSSGESGGGICSSNSTLLLANNLIAFNRAAKSGGGLYVAASSSGLITNNTIIGNAAALQSGGLVVSASYLTVANTIVAFNSAGVYSESGTAAFRNNCVYGNTAYNYSGINDPTGLNGNLAVDPGIAGVPYGGWHVQPASPCIDAGNNDYVRGTLDVDGQPRVQAATVDIGADESDGTLWPTGPYGVIRVSPQGDDGNDGSSWTLAKRSVQAGIKAAAGLRGEVWVQAGTYNECVTLLAFAHVYGGFSGVETQRNERNWRAQVTTLDGQSQGSVVTADHPGYGVSTLDGFTVTHGSAIAGGGMYLLRCSPTLANCYVVGNTASYGGGGLWLDWCAPILANNIIAGNSAASQGGGLYVNGAAPIVANNTITGNSAVEGGAAYLYYAPSAFLANTIIAFNSCGLHAAGQSPILRSNCAYGNAAYNYSGLTDPTGTGGNISADPGLVGAPYGGWHLQAGSPCVGTGYSGFAYTQTDGDGQPRILPVGGNVDIGADEFDGTPAPASFSVVRVSPLGDDAHDGSSWPLAKRTIQAAMQAAATAGGEGWAQAGTYAESITQPPFVHVYGGFAGTETLRAQRDRHAHRSILDGQQQGTVVTGGPGYAVSTLDGFTVTRGNATNGGGLCLSNASPTISNNTISANTATDGGGIYLRACCSRVLNNSIVGNSAANGGGLCSSNSSPIIANNIIAGNRGSWGGGYHVGSGSGTLTNNTIAGNDATDGGGIYLSEANPSIANTIIAFNSSGLKKSGTGDLRMQSSCLYGNRTYDYNGVPDPIGTNGNISVDPGLTDWTFGRAHLQPDSPCVGAGSNAFAYGDTDFEGQPRIQPSGGTVDIGATESDGTSPPSGPFTIVRVRPSGDDALDGSAWPLAKRTVQAAIDAAATAGGEVWVQAGTYYERITLAPFAHVYGGFDGTEATRAERDWSTHTTTLDGQQQGSVVNGGPGYAVSALDGFRITRGAATDGGGIRLVACSPTIANNTLMGNLASSSGGALYLSQSYSHISHNAIVGNKAAQGGGICVNLSTPTLENNVLSGNRGTNNGGGLYVISSSDVRIANSAVIGNSASGDGGGLYVFGSTAGIFNCTLTDNSARDGGGLHLSASSHPITVANTLIAFNSTGLYGRYESPVLRNNCVYGNASSDYQYVTNPTGTNGNISVDPRLAGRPYGDWHLLPDSPCVGAGDNAYALGTTDLDGQPRCQPTGAAVDIGADESDGSIPPAGPFTIIRVSLQGSDEQDGSSWTLAKRSLQAAIEAAALVGGEVWVQGGTYYECITLLPFAHVYGGFAGNETTRDERDWHTNRTTLDAQQQGSVVTCSAGNPGMSTLDGFTITHGSATNGGGVQLVTSSPTLANNTVIANTAATGAGIYLSSAAPTITNTVVTGNDASSQGGGLYSTSSSATISNCTVLANSAPPGLGGGLRLNNSTPTIANTIVAQNSSGVYASGSTATLRHNCVYANGLANYSGLPDPTGTDGNISADPELVGLACGGWHLHPDSPCVDAGDNSLALNSVDLDGQLRIQPLGGTVDIGADESDGTVPPWPFAIVHVSLAGDDTYDGSSWAQPKPSVQAGVGAAASSGGEVWVQAGTYFERISLAPFVQVYGGFAGTETERDQRDWRIHITTLDGQQLGSVVTGTPGYGISTLDGFTITHGSAASGGGIYLSASSPRLAHNEITTNSATSQGGGVYLTDYSCPTLEDNRITSNNAPNGAGLYSSGSSSPQIVRNWFGDNVAGTRGGALYLSASAPLISSNTFAANRATLMGGALYLTSASPLIVNNTLTGNSAAQGGALCLSMSSPTIANSIVAFNSSGLLRTGTGTPTLHNNCVFGNSAYNYSGLTDPTGTSGNISADPLFVQNPDPNDPSSTGDLHLQPASPCIDAGNNADVWGTTDLDGLARIVGGVVDIGAYEYPGPFPGDLNDDNVVDVTDVAIFASCFTGPDLAPLPDCAAADLDADTDVDLADFARLQLLAN